MTVSLGPLSLGSAAWWKSYGKVFAMLVALLGLAVALVPNTYSLQGPADVLIVVVFLLVAPAGIASVLARLRGTPLTWPHIAGIAAALALSVMAFNAGQGVDRSLGTHSCRFGWLTSGEVWVKLEPLPKNDGDATTYEVRFRWGGWDKVYSDEIERTRYLVIEKYDRFEDVPLAVFVSPDAYVSCGSSRIPANADRSAIL